MTGTSLDHICGSLRRMAVRLRDDRPISRAERQRFADVVLDAVRAITVCRADVADLLPMLDADAFTIGTLQQSLSAASEVIAAARDVLLAEANGDLLSSVPHESLYRLSDALDSLDGRTRPVALL